MGWARAAIGPARVHGVGACGESTTSGRHGDPRVCLTVCACRTAAEPVTSKQLLFCRGGFYASARGRGGLPAPARLGQLVFVLPRRCRGRSPVGGSGVAEWATQRRLPVHIPPSFLKRKQFFFLTLLCFTWVNRRGSIENNHGWTNGHHIGFIHSSCRTHQDGTRGCETALAYHWLIRSRWVWLEGRRRLLFTGYLAASATLLRSLCSCPIALHTILLLGVPCARHPRNPSPGH